MVWDRFRKKKRKRSQKSMQSESARLKEEEALLDFEISLEKARKRVAKKRRSQSTFGKFSKEATGLVSTVGKGIASAADTVFGGGPPPQKANPPPKANKKSTKKKKKKTSKKPKLKKKKDDDYFFPFF